MFDKKRWLRMKNNMKPAGMAVMIAMMIVSSTACGSKSVSTQESQSQTEEGTMTEETMVQLKDTAAELTDYVVEYSDRDTDSDWNEEDAVQIALTENGITANGQGVTVTGTTITITEEGTYVLSGSAAEANLVVNAPENKIHIVLNGVSMGSTLQAPISIEKSKKVIVTLAEGTENTIMDQRNQDVDGTGDTDATNEERENADSDTVNAAIYSKENLTFNGTGKLTVKSEKNNGITSKDELIFMEGDYDISADGHGITGKDFVAIKSGIFQITSGKDGIRSTNNEDANMGFVRIEDGTFTINAENDGIQAETLVYIMDGTMDITTGGGSENGVSHTNTDFPGGGFGQRPTDMPEMPDGELPDTMPNGAFPENMPQMPDQQEQSETGETLDDSTKNSETTEDTTSKKGIKAGKIVYLQDGTINFNTADDAVHSNGDAKVIAGTYNISSGDDGIHADALLTVEDGTITIVKSYEGLEGSQITLNNGTIDVTSSDDGVNVAGGNDGSSVNGRPGQNPFAVETQQEKVNQTDKTEETETTETEIKETEENAKDSNNELETLLTINGGTIHINASGDGLDSNGAIIQNGGDITVDGPENGGNGALDYDTTYTMNGGSLVALGSSGMMQSISDDSTVYCLSVIYSDNLTAGDEVTITDDSGNTLKKYTIAKSGNSIVYADENLKKDSKLTVSVNGKEQTVTLTDINTKLAADGTVSTGAITDTMGGGPGKGNRPEGMPGGQHMGRGKWNSEQDVNQTQSQE